MPEETTVHDNSYSNPLAEIRAQSGVRKEKRFGRAGGCDGGNGRWNQWRVNRSQSFVRPLILRPRSKVAKARLPRELIGIRVSFWNFARWGRRGAPSLPKIDLRLLELNIGVQVSASQHFHHPLIRLLVRFETIDAFGRPAMFESAMKFDRCGL
jgi:hypothetical protein